MKARDGCLLTDSFLTSLTRLKDDRVLFRNVSKLLIILYNTSQAQSEGVRLNLGVILRYVFGGNYVNVIRDAVLQGYVTWRKGSTPLLTEHGLKIAEILAHCWRMILDSSNGRGGGVNGRV